MNLACRNQRLPCTGVLDATPHGTFGCGQTDRALLRTRHSLLCRERGWRSYRPGQINLRLTALGSHSEAYRRWELLALVPTRPDAGTESEPPTSPPGRAHRTRVVPSTPRIELGGGHWVPADLVHAPAPTGPCPPRHRRCPYTRLEQDEDARPGNQTA